MSQRDIFSELIEGFAAMQAHHDALLTHLVAINARRTAKGQTGPIRLLHPEFQDPQSPAASKTLLNQEHSMRTLPGLQADLALNHREQAAQGS